MSESVRRGACHCGAVTFEATLPEDLASAMRCNCSMCRMRGAVAVTASAVEVLTGADAVATYRFNTRVAEHHFCTRCGIYTHHRRRSNPAHFGVNVACLEGVSPFDFACVPVSDGEHHANDTGVKRDAGTLHYVAAD